MAGRSPTLEGFRAVFHQPSLAAAEITWRWSFGTAACVLLGLSLLEYLNTLPVTPGDLLLVRSRQGFLIARALAHIFAGSAARLVGATLVLLPALAMAWMVTASFGRAATLKVLLGCFGMEAEAEPSPPPTLRFWRTREENWRLRSLLGLNFLRVALALTAIVGFWGAIILAGFASSDKHPRPGLAFLIFLFVLFLVWMLWSVVNWFLALASIFVVRDGRDTFGAISNAVALCRERFGPVLSAGFWFGLAHLGVFVAATWVVFLPMAFAGVLPVGVILTAILLVTLLYFAVADYLYVARLAAYVCIVADGHQPSAVSLQPAESPQSPIVSSQPEPSFDSEDLILSDLEAARNGT